MFVHHYDAILLGSERTTRWLALALARRSWKVLRIVYGPIGSTFHFGDHRLRRGTTLRSSAMGQWSRRVLDDLAANFLVRRWRPVEGGHASILGDGVRFRMLASGEALDGELERQEGARGDTSPMATWRSGALAHLGPALGHAVEAASSGWLRRQALVRALRRDDARARELCAECMDIVRRSAGLSARFATFAAAFDAPEDEEALVRLETLVRTTGPAIEVSGGAETLEAWADLQLERAGVTMVRARRAPGLISARGGHVVLELESDVVGGDALVEFDEGAGATSGSNLVAQFELPASSWVPACRRYVVCLVVRAEVLGPMHGLAMAVDASPTHGLGPLWCEVYEPSSNPRHVGLAVTTNLDGELPNLAEHVAGVRERIILRLSEVFPWLSRHLLVADSLHDGLPLWDYRSGARLPVERLSAGLPPSEPMPVRWRMGWRRPEARLPWYQTLFGRRQGHWVVDARAAARFGAEEPFVVASIVGHAIRDAFPTKKRSLAPWRDV